MKLIKFSAAHFRRNERGWAGAIGPGTLDRIERRGRREMEQPQVDPKGELSGRKRVNL